MRGQRIDSRSRTTKRADHTDAMSPCLFAPCILMMVGLVGPFTQAQGASACLPTFKSPKLVSIAGQLTETVFDAQCDYAYAANTTSNTIEVISLRNGTVGTPIQVGSLPTGLDLSPDGTTLYVADSGANALSVVNLRTRSVQSVEVPAGFLDDTPFSLAVAKNGLVLFSTTFSGSGFGGRMMQYDPATGSVSERTDFGATTEATFLKASQDRTSIGIVEGDDSGGPTFLYSSASNTFSSEKSLQSFITYVSLDKSGTILLVDPGTYVLGANLNQSGLIAGGSFGTAVDPGGAIGYQVSTSGVNVLNLRTLIQTGSLAISDTLSTANSFQHSVGNLAISADGTLLALLTDHGISLVQPKTTNSVGFASLTSQARLVLNHGSVLDSFTIKGTLHVGSASHGINPVENATQIDIGALTLTIPAKSFAGSGGSYSYKGKIAGVTLDVSLQESGAQVYQYTITGSNANLQGTSLPVNFGLSFTTDRGAVTLDTGDVQVATPE